MSGIGFATGTALFREQLSEGEKETLNERRDLKKWSAAQRMEKESNESETGNALAAAKRKSRDGFSASLAGYLQLIQETPLDELGYLLDESERTIVGEMGEMVRRTIIERLANENSQMLLEMVLERQSLSRSEYFSSDSNFIVESLLKKLDFEQLDSRFSEMTIPTARRKWRQELYGEMLDSDPVGIWKRAADTEGLDLVQLLRSENAAAAIDHLSNVRLSGVTRLKIIQNGFRFLTLSGETGKLESLTKPGEREAALEGIAFGKRDEEDFESVKIFADSLASDAEALNFYRSLFGLRSTKIGADGIFSPKGDRAVQQIVTVFGADESLVRIEGIENDYVRKVLQREFESLSLNNQGSNAISSENIDALLNEISVPTNPGPYREDVQLPTQPEGGFE